MPTELAPPAARPPTIVVIDDVADVVDSIVMLLELEGYRAIGSMDGPTGIDRAAEAGADLVVLDYMIPGMDGAAIGRALRPHPALPGLKILMCTGTPESVVRQAFAGYDGFLAKPVFPEALLAAVRSMLEERGTETA